MESRFDEALRSTFSQAERVLVVDAPAFAHGQLTHVRGTDAALAAEGPFDGALIRAEPDLVTRLCSLRTRLTPGAKLVVALELSRSPWRRLQELASGSAGKRPGRDEVCEALLLSGLAEPSVVFEGSAWLAAQGKLPDALDALDELFTQLRATLAR